MIKINSFIHRQVLDDIIRRWMYDEACQADADLIIRLVHFNHVYGSMAAADDWSFAKHIRSRGEAIRQLVALGA